MIDLTTLISITDGSTLPLQEVTAWLSPQTANLVGAYGGAGIGTVCGIIGAMAGVLAPRGKGRGLVVGSLKTIGVLGLISLVFGIAALIAGQPSFVGMPFMLLGFICSTVCLPLVPVIGKRYQEAEQRRIEAQALRRS